MLAARQYGFASSFATQRFSDRVLICHGIGQQAQFETLNEVVEAFKIAHETEWILETVHKSTDRRPSVREIEFFPTEETSDDLLPLAQLELKRCSDHRTRAFHFFEVYWAPMTEAVVGFWDVIFFLLKAGWEGVLASLKGEFFRFTFGKEQRYKILPMTGVQLGVAFLVVISLVLNVAAFGTVIAANFVGHFGFSLPAHVPA